MSENKVNASDKAIIEAETSVIPMRVFLRPREDNEARVELKSKTRIKYNGPCMDPVSMQADAARVPSNKISRTNVHTGTHLMCCNPIDTLGEMKSKNRLTPVVKK